MHSRYLVPIALVAVGCVFGWLGASGRLAETFAQDTKTSWPSADGTQLGQREALVLYLGDDETDENAFYAMQDAITIKVGDPSDTSAHYHVEAPDNVCDFLFWLERVTTKTAKETAP